MILKKLLLVLAVISHTSYSFGTVYKYHPKSRIYLGGGYNPFKPEYGYLKCIIHDGEESVDSSGAITSQVQITQISSRQEFYKTIDLSSTLAGSYMFMNGEASFHIEENSSFHEDTLTWMILFKSDYGRFVLKNPRLNPVYESLNDQELYQTCGSEIVTERKKQVLAYAMFYLKNVNHEKKKNIETFLRARARGVSWNAQMETSYKSILKEAIASHELKLSVFALGGRGITDLASLIDDNQDAYQRFSNVPKQLSEYVKNMSDSNAVPTEFVTTHISTFRHKMPLQYDNFHSQHVATLYHLYLDALSIISRISDILSEKNKEPYNLSQEEKNTLKTHSDEQKQIANLYFSAAKKCFDPNETCRLPEDVAWQPKSIKWPKSLGAPHFDPCFQMRLKALKTACIDGKKFEQATGDSEIPLCIDNELYGWQSCP